MNSEVNFLSELSQKNDLKSEQKVTSRTQILTAKQLEFTEIEKFDGRVNEKHSRTIHETQYK